MKLSFTRALPLFSACAALALPLVAQEKRDDAPPRPNGQRPPGVGVRDPGSPDGQRPGQFQGRGADFMATLTEEQREVVREAFQANGEKMRELGEQLMAARKTMQEAVWAEKLDADLIRKKAEEMGKIEGEFAVLRAQGFAKLRPLLSAEQLEKIKASPMFGGGQGMFQGRPRGDAPEGGPRPQGEVRRPGGGDRGERKPDAPPKN